MKKSLYTALVLLIFLAGCQKEASQNTVPSTMKVTIAEIGHEFLNLPIYVAKSKGFFSEQGLNVEFVSTGSDDKTYEALISGSAQFGVTDPVSTAIAREHGRDCKVIASLVNGIPFWGVTYRRDIDSIDEPQQFTGLRIATYPSPSPNFAAMEETLKQAGLTGKAQIIQGASGTLLALLKAEKADMVMETEPVASIAVKDGAHIAYSVARRFDDFAFTGITMTSERLTQDPKLTQAVVSALASAIEWIHADFEETLVVAHAEFPEIPEDVLRASLRHLRDDKVIPSSVVLSESAWKNAVELRRSTGGIKGDASFAENIDTQFAQQAHYE